MGVLIILAQQIVRQLVRRAGVPLLLGAGGAVAGAEITGGGPFPGFFGIGGGDGNGIPRHPHRRRKKALTESDVRLALTIASAISKKAAENFILQRTRSS